MPDQNDNLFQTLLQKATSVGPTSPSMGERAKRTLIQQGIESLGRWPISSFLGSAPFESGDRPYLEQFLNPEHNIFPYQTLRPSHMKNLPNIPWRDFGPIVDPEKYQIVQSADGGSVDIYEERPQGERIKALLMSRIPKVGGDFIAGHQLSLGGHTKSIGQDEQGHPYFSIYDVWDFESPAIGKVPGLILNKLGQPFAIYGRYPLERVDGSADTHRFKK